MRIEKKREWEIDKWLNENILDFVNCMHRFILHVGNIHTYIHTCIYVCIGVVDVCECVRVCISKWWRLNSLQTICVNLASGARKNATRCHRVRVVGCAAVLLFVFVLVWFIFWFFLFSSFWLANRRQNAYRHIQSILNSYPLVCCVQCVRVQKCL